MKKAIITLLIILTVNVLLSAIINAQLDLTSEYIYVLKVFQKILIIALSIIAIVYHNLGGKIKNTGWISTFVGIGILAYAIQIAFGSTTEISLLYKISFIVFCISVGIFEELLFRVFVFFKIRELQSGQSIFYTILLASSIFAIAHFSNILNPNIVKISVINQVVLALGIGMILQVIYLKFKNIVLISALHASFNILGTYKARFNLHKSSSEEFTTLDFFINLSILIFIVLVIIVPIIYLYAKKLPIDKKLDSIESSK